MRECDKSKNTCKQQLHIVYMSFNNVEGPQEKYGYPKGHRINECPKSTQHRMYECPVKIQIKRCASARQHVQCRPVTVRPPVKQAVTLPVPFLTFALPSFKPALSCYLQSLQARAECLYLSHNVACRQLLQAGRHDEFNKDDIKITVNNRLDLMLSECNTYQRIMWYSLFSHSRCTS